MFVMITVKLGTCHIKIIGFNARYKSTHVSPL